MTIDEFYDRLENMEIQADDFENITGISIETHWRNGRGQPSVPKWAIHWLETKEKNEILITGLNDLLDKVSPPILQPQAQIPPVVVMQNDEPAYEKVSSNRTYTREKLPEVLQNGEIVYFRHADSDFAELDFQAVYHKPREGNPAKVFEWRKDGKMYALSSLTKIVYKKINRLNSSGAYDGYTEWVNGKGIRLFDLVRSDTDCTHSLFSEQ